MHVSKMGGAAIHDQMSDKLRMYTRSYMRPLQLSRHVCRLNVSRQRTANFQRANHTWCGFLNTNWIYLRRSIVDIETNEPLVKFRGICNRHEGPMVGDTV